VSWIELAQERVKGKYFMKCRCRPFDNNLYPKFLLVNTIIKNCHGNAGILQDVLGTRLRWYKIR
jgi:hypothetical protein